MKQTEENGGLRRISNEEVERIINNRRVNATNGCGCGCGDWGWHIVGCGSDGTSIDMGYGSGMQDVDYDDDNPYNIHLDKTVTSNSVLSDQIHELLASSQSLQNILSPYSRGIYNLTIKVGGISDGSVMTTDVGKDGNATITINALCINSKGFDAYSYGEDNAGYAGDGNAASLFSTAFAHEALHAKHYYWYYESQRYGNGQDDDAVEFLRNRGFSEDFIRIFYNQTAEGWNSALKGTGPELAELPKIVEKREHDYFGKYEKEVFGTIRDDFYNRYN